eukprot:CAMPEP_0185761774 /NCGR_PEP_ID=MMETSP1174-20130828/20712_1 /TAXON_ID=35687 /ORGANISM="Dictyocha speculum, Strain CCMP1381" /LENGTH=90 /DNA_ID=CAMNT_0028443147 /DNA_START=17 /DNA_END=286 /DNA_ORIENTATION=+
MRMRATTVKQKKESSSSLWSSSSSVLTLETFLELVRDEVEPDLASLWTDQNMSSSEEEEEEGELTTTRGADESGISDASTRLTVARFTHH